MHLRHRVTSRRLRGLGLSALLGAIAMLACASGSKNGVSSSSDAAGAPAGEAGSTSGSSSLGGAGGTGLGGTGDAPTGGASTGGTPEGGTGGTSTGGTPEGGTGGASTGGTPAGGTSGTSMGGTPVGGTSMGGTPAGGKGGTSMGGTPAGGKGGTSMGGTPAGGKGGSAGGPSLFFDDFLGSSIDSSKWTVVQRISDQANGELNGCVAANVRVSGGRLLIDAKHEDVTIGDSNQAPVLMHYTSGQIQQLTPPFLYGTVTARLKPPGGTGVWPCFWMLGFEWQASQPLTANVVGHRWPQDGWCESDIAEFFVNHRTVVNTSLHYQTADTLHEIALPFDASTRFMVYRLEWSQNSMIWSVDAEDGSGFRTLRSVTGAGRVPDDPQYVILNMAVGGNGGGTPNPATFPLTMEVDWVRVTQP